MYPFLGYDDFESRSDWAFGEKENVIFSKFCMVNFENSDVGWKFSTVLHVRNRGILTGGIWSMAVCEVQEGTIVRPHQEYVTGVLRQHETVGSGLNTFRKHFIINFSKIVVCINFGVKDDFPSRSNWAIRKIQNLIFSKFLHVDILNIWFRMKV
jgi:hypothetical protein